MKMRKGITPIIAVIILLLITMALAAAAWAFLSGYMGTLVGKSFIIPGQAAGCTSGGVLSVYITNTGNTNIVREDIDMCMLDGADCSTDLVSGVTVEPQHMEKVLENTTATTGSHTVQLGIGASTGQIEVYCP